MTSTRSGEAGSTPARLSAFGPVAQGGASFGGLYHPIDDDLVQEALETAWDLGTRAFDTAPHYGVGVSEERLGRFLADKPRAEFVLSTKVGRLLVEDASAPTSGEGFVGTPQRRRVRDYSAAGVRRSLEESLQRMGLDRVDLALIHDPEDFMPAALSDAAPALSALRAEGTIGGWGVGTNFIDVAERMVHESDLDVVMIAGRYSLLDRSAGRTLLPACLERGIEVLAAGVLNSGLLADPGAVDAHYDYAPADPQRVATARRLEDACLSYGLTLRAAALQFPLRHRAVIQVVLGAGTSEQIRDSHEQLRATIPQRLWAELDQLVEDGAPD